MEYLSVRHTYEKRGISKRKTQILCEENRIHGVMRVGFYWVIPSDAKKPKDARIKNGQNIKESNA